MRVGKAPIAAGSGLWALAFVSIVAISVMGLPAAHISPVETARISVSNIPLVPPLQIQSFSYTPGTVQVNSQTQGMIQISGGVPPYHAWLNGTPPGCQPNQVPYVTSNISNTFTCNPNSPGNYNVHLDVLDSASPAAKVSSSAQLNVNSNSNGNGSGGGSGKGNGSSGFNLPNGLIVLLTSFAIVLLGAIVALAAGVIALAISVSRGLRRVNDTLAAQTKTSRVDPPAK